jgi:hypothetical protein
MRVVVGFNFKNAQNPNRRTSIVGSLSNTTASLALYYLYMVRTTTMQTALV